MTITELPQTEVLTRKEFLDNMIAYYSEDPEHRRSQAGPDTCFYHQSNGAKCAIGRWIPDDQYDSAIEGVTVCDDLVFRSLPEKLKDLGMDFLADVQKLHDNGHWWCANGLNETGEKRALALRIRYNCQ